MLKKKLYLYIYIFSVITSVLSAANYPDRGVYGSLSFLYRDDQQKLGAYESSRDQFQQNYTIGYSGNIYSPSLLNYSLSTAVKINKQNIQNTEASVSSKDQSQSYGANLNFIQNTNYPFRIYFNSNTTPTTSMYYNSVAYYTYDTESKGLTGSVNLDPFKIRYEAKSVEGISQSADRIQSTQTNNYNTSLFYSSEAHIFNVAYRYLEEENGLVYNDDNSTTDRHRTSVRQSITVSDKWKIYEDLNMNSKVSYQDDKNTQSSTVRADTSLSWSPKEKKYTGSLSLGASRLAYANRITDTYNISQNLSYKLTPTLTISESISMYSLESPSVSSNYTSMVLGASHRYRKKFFEDMLFDLRTNIGAQQFNSKTVSKTDSNTTNSTSTNTSRETYDFRIGANVSKPLSSINSSMTMNSYYLKSVTVGDSSRQNYSLRLSLSSKFLRIITNSMAASYQQFDSSRKQVNGENISSSSSVRVLSDSLSFPLRLGIKGRMNFRAGIYSRTATNNGTVTTNVSPSAGVTLNYRFFTKLMFRSGITVNQVYDTLSYTGNANLTYVAGKSSFSMKYMYNKQETTGAINAGEQESSSLMLQATRKF